MPLPSPIQPGLYANVADAEYRKAPGVSQTALKAMAHSAAHFRQELDRPSPPTAPMVIGRIAHHVLLTPATPGFWTVKPRGMKLSTKEGKAWAESQGDLEIVSDADWQNIMGAVDSLKNFPAFLVAMEEPNIELSAFARFQTPRGEITRKGRMDVVPPGCSIVDVKFVEDARREEFSRLVFARKYYMQAAYYIDLYNDAKPEAAERKDLFILFAVEKEPPFACNVFQVHELEIDLGRTEYQRYLNCIAACLEGNDYPAYHPHSAYSTDIQTLTLPQWGRRQLTGSFI